VLWHRDRPRTFRERFILQTLALITNPLAKGERRKAAKIDAMRPSS
jgi:hypothetical protein